MHSHHLTHKHARLQFKTTIRFEILLREPVVPPMRVVRGAPRIDKNFSESWNFGACFANSMYFFTPQRNHEVKSNEVEDYFSPNGPILATENLLFSSPTTAITQGPYCRDGCKQKFEKMGHKNEGATLWRTRQARKSRNKQKWRSHARFINTRLLHPDEEALWSQRWRGTPHLNQVKALLYSEAILVILALTGSMCH